MTTSTRRLIPGYSDENVIKRAWFTWIGPLALVFVVAFVVALVLLFVSVPA